MRVWLNQLDGTTTQAVIEENSTLKEFLEMNNLINMRLVCQGSNVTSSSFGSIAEDANLWVQGGLEGGKRKRKKKVYTTKKKNKHIHRKVKMGILNLYSVDGKGNVTQQRKTCPHCGPGIFMAQHWDRYYCGFCHTTIKMDAETVKKNEEILKKKRAALEAEKNAKAKDAADKAPAGKKDAKKKKK